MMLDGLIIEGGLQLANNIISDGTAKHKYIVLVTDGFPTTYVRRIDGSGNIIGYDTHVDYADLKPGNIENAGEDGYFYNFQLNDGDKDRDNQPGRWCYYGTSYSDKGADKAQAMAQSIHSKGINIFTVGVDVEGQSIQKYINQDLSLADIDKDGTGETVKDHSVVDTYDKGDDVTVEDYPYIIESVDPATNVIKDINGNVLTGYRLWLAAKIAGGNDLARADSIRYCDGSKLADLQGALSQILRKIKEINEQAIQDTYITNDPMVTTLILYIFIIKMVVLLMETYQEHMSRMVRIQQHIVTRLTGLF